MEDLDGVCAPGFVLDQAFGSKPADESSFCIILSFCLSIRSKQTIKNFLEKNITYFLNAGGSICMTNTGYKVFEAGEPNCLTPYFALLQMHYYLFHLTIY